MPSPSHTPHSSNSAVPPHSPEQSSVVVPSHTPKQSKIPLAHPSSPPSPGLNCENEWLQ